MLDKIVITKDNGETVNADFISCFKTNVGGRDAVFYLTTVNEVDPNGLYKIQASELVNGKLQTIASDTDWAEVKNIMRAIISGSLANFSYIEKSATVLGTVDYGRVIAVQLPAKDKMASDYKEKLPQATINNIVAEVKPVEEPPLNTPQVEGGSVVAPGIVETPVAPNPMSAPSTETMPLTPPEVSPSIEAQANQVLDNVLDAPANPAAPINPAPMTDTPVAEQPINPAPAVEPMPSANPIDPFSNAEPSAPAPVMSSQEVAPAETIALTTSNVNMADLEKQMEPVIEEAKNIFLESAKNLADKIIAEALEKVKNNQNN